MLNNIELNDPIYYRKLQEESEKKRIEERSLLRHRAKNKFQQHLLRTNKNKDKINYIKNNLTENEEIRKMILKKKINYDSESEVDDIEDRESDEDINELKNITENKLQIDNSIMNMGFMKKAAEKEEKELKKHANELLNEINNE